jgi:hypothetical protein
MLEITNITSKLSAKKRRSIVIFLQGSSGNLNGRDPYDQRISSLPQISIYRCL